ncbi:hypothetical protein BC826DRAFT_1093769 [Russula brevipes]|nr:hypothetical protein BC826DRAFT_1093769 [Russula brevipes]
MAMIFGLACSRSSSTQTLMLLKDESVVTSYRSAGPKCGKKALGAPVPDLGFYPLIIHRDCVDNGDDRVIAFGDFNGDHFLDVITLASDDLTTFSFRHSASFRHPQGVHNVVPGDYPHDGKLDVLRVMAQAGSSTQLSLLILFLTNHVVTHPIELPPSALAQPMPFDSDDQMRIDLPGLQPGSSRLKMWRNVSNASHPSGSLYEINDAPFSRFQCRISNPHINAAVDLNGDRMTDGSLPADIVTIQLIALFLDRDGTIDLLITTCTSVSRSTGLGTNCVLNIAYNTQFPLCSSSSSFPLAGDPRTAPPCRSPPSLCVADSNFSFFFRPTWNYASVPISHFLQGDAKTHVFDTSFSPAQPIVPLTGDANLYGFPDLLLITEGRVRLLLSAPRSRDVRVAVFADLDEDGTLDVMVQRTGAQGEGRVLFVQNNFNFYFDAFFMKLFGPVLNGACSSGWCLPENSSLTPYPVSFPLTSFRSTTSGVSYKYTILDTSGRRSPAQALNTPYAFFGLERMNNYIENLFAGAARTRVAALEMLIPNSKLVINPRQAPGEWHKGLYLRPGQWIP